MPHLGRNPSKPAKAGTAPTQPWRSLGRRWKPGAFLFLTLGALGPLQADAPDPIVAVTGGLVAGRNLPDGSGMVFRGVPFAQPPIGSLRWREPSPVAPWAGLRDAGKSGPPAAQASFGWNAADAAAGSEDCLYLDVWTPGVATRTPMPVMVWFHGGGNVGGAGGFDALYDGGPLIAHGVVLVDVEYRLGIFAFLAHPELSAESAHHASGNYGILDQVAALRWVRDNIARFGGDPGNVTIFGQSAGGTDVLALMATPLSQGLFQKAIAESGLLTPGTCQPLEKAEAVGRSVAGAAGSGLASLRAMPVADLLRVQMAAPGLRPFTVDGWVFPQAPFDVWRRGGEHAVPLIIGSNGVEFAFAGSKDALKAAIAAFAGGRAPGALALYGLSGAAKPEPDPLYGDAADQWGSDQFRCYSAVEALWRASQGHPTWQYEFDRPIPPHPHVAHSGDLGYVFGNLHRTGNLPGEYTEADRRLSAAVQAYWTQFAKSGDPNGPGSPEWPGFDPDRRRYVCFTPDARVEVRASERRAFVDLFRDVLEANPSAP
jgi:para-nitrobenzyl esterase